MVRKASAEPFDILVVTTYWSSQHIMAYWLSWHIGHHGILVIMAYWSSWHIGYYHNILVVITYLGLVRVASELAYLPQHLHQPSKGWVPNKR